MSKDDRLVTPPANARGIYIPQEYIAICTENKTRVIPRGKRKGERIDATEYNLAAAAILRLIERWAHWKIRQAHGKLDLDAAWIWMPQKQLEDFELVNAFGGGQIKTGIALLLDKGFISRRNNPELGFDRTYQYRFEKKAVQDALDKLAPFLTIDDWKHEHSSMEQSEPIDASTNSDEAISQVPSQVPSQEEKTLSGAEAAPDAPRYAVGMRVVVCGDYGMVCEVLDAKLDSTARQWLYSVRDIARPSVAPRWTWESDCTPAPDPEPPAPPADPPTPPTPKRGRAPDLLFEAVAAAFKYERMNDSERGQVNKACKLLRQSQVTPEEVPSLYAWCAAQGWPGAFTPLAMAKHVNDWRNSKRPASPSQKTYANGMTLEEVRAAAAEVAARASAESAAARAALNLVMAGSVA